jgi:hypothetical protein
MNAASKASQQWATEVLTHEQRVTRLYRKALRLSLAYLIDRGEWHRFAWHMRLKFKCNQVIDVYFGL